MKPTGMETQTPSFSDADHFILAFATAAKSACESARSLPKPSPEEAVPKEKVWPKAPRKLTPRRVETASLISESPLASEWRDTGSTIDPDPFLRPPKSNAGERSSNVTVKNWPSSAADTSAPERHQEDIQPKRIEEDDTDLLSEDALRAAISFHQACVHLVPHRLYTTLHALSATAQAATAPVAGAVLDWTGPSPTSNVVRSWASLRFYVGKVLMALSDVIITLPEPIYSAFCACEFLPLQSLPAPGERTFPLVNEVPPWQPPALSKLPSPRLLEEEEELAQKLSQNLEVAWDQVLYLRRQYLGETQSCAPGSLDLKGALFAMAALHPANVDVFALRFLELVSRSALQARDAPPKIRQLGERLRSAGQATGSGDTRTRGAQRGGPSRGGRRPSRGGGRGGHSRGGNASVGVVLHRLPAVVRSMFESDPTELFFLDFLTGVDSAKLYAALIPRLTAALLRSMAAAAAATSNLAFTESVIDARRYAKFLCVAVNTGNWAHSEHSLSGNNEQESPNKLPGLGSHSLQWRSPIHSASWTGAFDIATTVESAVESGQLLAILASVSVADVIIRMSSVDPVTRESDWYRHGILALQSFHVLSAGSASNVEDRPATSMPLLNIMIGELLDGSQAPAISPKQDLDPTILAHDRNEWGIVGDTRLITECCPCLDELRRLLLQTARSTKGSQSSKTVARRITPIATHSADFPILGQKSPVASGLPKQAESYPNARQRLGQDEASENSDIDEQENVAAALRREFYTRMDGRLRELIGVVLSSKPSNADEAIRAYTAVAKALYPATPQTVISVAARICGRDAEKQRQLVHRPRKVQMKSKPGGHDSDTMDGITTEAAERLQTMRIKTSN